jgi:C4-type Zn-finger protein
MKISCESCGAEEWKMVIHAVKLPVGEVVYSAIKCENCDMVYPLQELAKGRGMSVSKDSVIGMLKR